MGINFSNVGFTYDVSASKTLSDINLQINKNNEFITILGHTGSGKSTLVQLMNALNLPSEGSIKIMDTLNIDSLFITLIVMGIISSLTIGGKAIEKALPKFAEHKFLAKVYQALRIEVNQEMKSLENMTSLGIHRVMGLYVE